MDENRNYWKYLSFTGDFIVTVSRGMSKLGIQGEIIYHCV
jgi:hypothetical protein